MLAKRTGAPTEETGAYLERLRAIIPNRYKNGPRANEAKHLFDKYRKRISRAKGDSAAVLEQHLKDAEKERNEKGISPFSFPKKPVHKTDYGRYLNNHKFYFHAVEGPHWAGPDEIIWFKDSEGVKWVMGPDSKAFKADNAWFLDPPLYNFP